MKRLLAVVPALALLAMPSQAEAAWGFTHHSGIEYSTRGYYFSPFETLPTIDIRNSGVIVQIDALETLAGLTREEVHLGVNVYKNLQNGPVTENGQLKGAFQVGGSVDIDGAAPDFSFDPLNAQVLGQARMGVQAHNEFGFGIYVVPGVGFAKTYDFAGDDAFELAVGGQLQISAWIK